MVPLNSTDRKLGCHSPLKGGAIIDHRGMYDQAAQWAMSPWLNREFPLSSLSGQYLLPAPKKRKGKERKGKERKGKERKGKERKGKERKEKKRKEKKRKEKKRKEKKRKEKKRKGKLRGYIHALPPSLGKMEATHSPFAKIYFTKPPGSLPARAKQRGLENQRTNQPKQPIESKEREAPRCKWSQPPSSSVLLEPSSA
uniref:Uncharacterized protein n=1 Tax=Pipistrellus kuhlii TaxID=59472 RepID=A0A7J8A881_PIPKU|nr:hypothetical protein mPipKuh1_008957 [Pipistrellus kuhlii]